MPEKQTNRGELPPEVDKYLSALVKDPKSKAFVPLADAYRKAGMLDEAIQVAKDGLKHNPGYISGRFVLGRCYYEKGMFKEAEEELQRVVKSNPENADAHRILARIMDMEGNLEQALKKWDIVLTLVSNDEEAKRRMEEIQKVLAPAESKTNDKQEVFQKVEEIPEVPEPTEPALPEIPEAESVSIEEPLSDTKVEKGAIQMAVEEKKEAVEEAEKKKDEKLEAGRDAEEEKGAGQESPEIEFEKESKITFKDDLTNVVAADAGTIGTSIPSGAEESIVEREAETGIKMQDIPGKTDEVKPSGPKLERVEKDEHLAIKGKEVSSTKALAEMYLKQGYYERALKVYRDLEAITPGDPEIAPRIKYIEEELKKKGAVKPVEDKFKENIKTLSSWLEKIKRGG